MCFFNIALNTFYLRLYGDELNMVKGHSDSVRGNPLLLIHALFPVRTRVILYAPSHRQDSIYNGFCYTSRGTGLEREIAQWVHYEGSILRPMVP